MSNHKNQQALNLKLKHFDGQVGLKSTEFLSHCKWGGEEKEGLPRALQTNIAIEHPQTTYLYFISETH